MLSSLAPIAAAFATPQTAWIVESDEFAADVRRALQTPWNVVACGASGSACVSPSSNVSAVVGRADALDLTKLTQLELVQGASYFYTDFDAVPDRAAIATVTGYWPQLGDEQIAEWVVAAIFENQYRMAQRAEAFRACAFASDAPSECASDSGATNHTMVSDLTVGVLGYGNIGSRVAQRAAALGATVVATKPSGPFVPPPVPLKWLSSDNDRLYREADVIVVTVPGSGHPDTVGLINRTSLGLMRDGVHRARQRRADQFWRPRGGADRAPGAEGRRRHLARRVLALPERVVREAAGPALLAGDAVARGAAERDAAAGDVHARRGILALLGRVRGEEPRRARQRDAARGRGA